MHLLFVRIALTIILLCSASSAQSPPFRKVTITGKTKADYNKVSLFKSGRSKRSLGTNKKQPYTFDLNWVSYLKLLISISRDRWSRTLCLPSFLRRNWTNNLKHLLSISILIKLAEPPRKARSNEHFFQPLHAATPSSFSPAGLLFWVLLDCLSLDKICNPWLFTMGRSPVLY